ncbi:DUF2062 domain-containing protein [Pirellulaceae bacterium SH449]
MTSGTAKRKTNLLIDLLSRHRTPGAIAGGMAFGTMLGLMPKDSLVAVCILLLIAVLPVNQLLACVATLGLTLAESLTWGVTDRIGFLTLNLDIVSSLIGSLYQFPIAPWLRLENTVVMGSLILGVATWMPCFLLTYRLSTRIQRAISTDEVAVLAATALRRQSADSLIELPLSPNFPPPTPLTDRVEQELVSSEPDAVSVTIPAPTEATVPVATEDRVLHETLIEVIRFKRPYLHSRNDTDNQPVHSSPENQSMHLTNLIRKDSNNVPPYSVAAKTHATVVTTSTGTAHIHSQPHTKEDSLRHILKHIHSSRDSKREAEKSS